MQIGERYFLGAENLVVKVMADTYLSDPDIYISKVNKFPNSTKTAEWHCKRDSSDTCVVDNKFIKVGDTFNIGINC